MALSTTGGLKFNIDQICGSELVFILIYDKSAD